MRGGLRFWLAVLALNLAFALGLRAIGPPQPVYTDRGTYEAIGRHGLGPDCQLDFFCYRVLVPAALDRVPLASEQRWRLYEAVMVTLAGFITALAVAGVVSPPHGPVLATLLAQLSFGFTYTAYDPFTVDAAVYVVAAIVAFAWLTDRWWLALAVGGVGVFVKQTTLIVVAVPALAAVLSRDVRNRRRWVLQTCASLTTMGAFYVLMQSNGWSISPASQSADLLGGGWLVKWINELGLWTALFYVFIPFGFVWAFALLGFAHAPSRLRALALGTVLPLVALIYVQTTERALANFFFVVIPLAVPFLNRLPPVVAYTAAITNGLLTAKVGLSTTWLPPAAILFVPALLGCVWAINEYRRLRGREPEHAQRDAVPTTLSPRL